MYHSSSKIIQSVLDRKGDIKTMLYQQNKSINTAVYALVTKTLQYRQVLEEIISSTPHVSKEYNHKKNKQHRGLMLLLIYELLFGRKRLKINYSKRKRFNELVLNNKNALNSALVRIKIKKEISNNDDLIDNKAENNYIYARINTILTDSDEIISQLIKKHHFNLYKNENEYKLKQKQNEKEKEKAFWSDTHIPNLLVFTWHCCIAPLSFCIDGHLIIQNKSSCIPAFILNPDTNSFILDCCAAPGNKTSHLINIILEQNRNKFQSHKTYVVALDYDMKRCDVLKKRIKLFGMEENVNVLHKDFLSIDAASLFAHKFNTILLDPTCSGSGLVHHRLAHYDNNKKLKIPKLSEMQKKMVLHAMQFQNVKKIIYSTCSINEEENEQVVEYALNNSENKFKIIEIFNAWKERGIGNDKYEFSENVVRVNNENQHNLHGFFVACFERIKGNNSNENNIRMPAAKRRKLNSDKKKWKVNLKGFNSKSHARKKWNR